MIVDNPKNHWIFVIPANRKRRVPMTLDKQQKMNDEYLRHWGKWLIFEPKKLLKELAKKLDFYVEKGEIPSAKYARTPQLGSKVPVMCVYCDDRERETIWAILLKLGVKTKIWKYDRQTIEDWKPNGRLFIKAIETQ